MSIFSGTRRDGHGQHQAAGVLAREAFEAAGDPRRFPEQLAAGTPPWMPLKLYRSTRFDTAATTLAVETGHLDPMYGRSYHQIAMASRSRHRSQDMGRIEALGPRRTRLQLLESRVTVAGREETSLFDGIDTTLAGLLSALPAGEARQSLAQRLAGYRSHLLMSREALSLGSTAAVVPHLSRAVTDLRGALELTAEIGPAATTLAFVLGQDEEKLQRALAEAAGVIVDAFSDDDLLVPGQSLEVEVQIWNAGGKRIGLRDVRLGTPEGWVVEPLGQQSNDLEPETLAGRRFRLTVPSTAEPTQPYFLRETMQRAVYSWPADPQLRARPFGPPVVEAEVELEIAGQPVRCRVEAVHRFADQARGEVRRPLYVVPAVGLELAPSLAVWPRGRGRPVAFSVSLRGEALGGVKGSARLELPQGWAATPAAAAFEISGPGRSASIDFLVQAPPDVEAGSYAVAPVVETTDGRSYRLGYSIIDYPHIRRRLLFEPAMARIAAFDLQVDTSVRAAYVPGASDEVAAAIAAMGLRVDVLTERAIAGGDLSAYDVIVLGIRAYETNAILVESNERMLEWVRSGGTLIVQYQQYGYFNGDYAPYPLKARWPHDRVSDERAPIRLLAPGHPLFNRPNPIGPGDFDDWVQERGLYFAHEWDGRYQPLLQTADSGEAPKRGGLLIARYGEGLYVYTGLSLFRQIPAGVPGAYRLLANLLSLRG